MRVSKIASTGTVRKSESSCLPTLINKTTHTEPRVIFSKNSGISIHICSRACDSYSIQLSILLLSHLSTCCCEHETTRPPIRLHELDPTFACTTCVLHVSVFSQSDIRCHCLSCKAKTPIPLILPDPIQDRQPTFHTLQHGSDADHFYLPYFLFQSIQKRC